MNVQLVEDGEFVHSTELPEAPQPGQFVRVHSKCYKVISVTWNVTRTFPYQKPGLDVDVVEVVGGDRPLSQRKVVKKTP